MANATKEAALKSESAFPALEVENRLRAELQAVAADSAVLRPEWEPMLDSKRIVATVLCMEDLLPGRKLPPDKIVRKGGYDSVEEAVSDMLDRIRQVLGVVKQPRVRQ